MSCDIFHCFNYRCFFRVNDLPVESHCENAACPNRFNSDSPIMTNGSLSSDEIKAYVERIKKLRKEN